MKNNAACEKNAEEKDGQKNDIAANLLYSCSTEFLIFFSFSFCYVA
jgi:hypothetical protein